LSSKEANLYSKSTEKTILHNFKSKKSFYKLTIAPIENKYKIVKANIVSDNFNGANLLNNIIRDMKLNVYTYSNEEENAEKGYVENGDIYINLNKDTGLNSTTLIHEMSHLLFAGMKSLNKDVYIDLINNINDLIKEGNKDIIDK
jgi:Zn-dependent peptidase ImmA (M78 family)